MSTAPTRTPMVGRRAEIQVLFDAFQAGRDGHPRVVVVRGEAGIGKTRLLQDFRDKVLAAAGGPPVVFAVGQCVEVGTIGAPFTPVRRLLRELHDGVGDDEFRGAARSPAVIATLATLVPELAAPAGGAAPGGEFVTEAVERVIESLSTDRHLVLVIEDLHWADTATLDLLRTLAVTLRGAHVTMIMTYRSDDVGRTHPLRPVLAELDRSRVVTGLELKRLTPAEVTQLARSISAEASADELAVVASRSEGVPFFVEELVELRGEELPDTLRAIVLARYERLGVGAREVVDTLSAGGVQVDHALLERVYAGTRDDLDSALREALSANVLVATGDGYAFRHALIQEVVHADLLPSARTAHHRRYAEVIQERVDAGADADAAAAAEHWLAARDVSRAFDATVTARDHAAHGAALRTAALLGERLLDLWPQIPDAAMRAGMSAQRVIAEVATQWNDAGDMDRAIRVGRSPVPVAEDPDPLGLGHARWAVARALGNTGRINESTTEAAAAVAVLETSDDPRATTLLARALALYTLNLATTEAGNDADLDGVLDRAIGLAEASGDADAYSSCVLNRAWLQIDRGEASAAVETIRPLLRSDASDAARLNACNSMVDALVRLGRLDEAIQQGLEGMRRAGDVGLERSYGSYIATNVGEAMIAVGRAEEAVPILERARELLTRSIAFASFAARLLALHHSWNDEPDAASALLAASIMSRDEDAEEAVGWAEVETESMLNLLGPGTDSEERRTRISEALSAAALLGDDRIGPWPGRHQRLLAGAARAVAEAELAGIDEPAAEAARDALSAAAALHADLPGSVADLALVGAERARSEGDDVPAVSAWRDALRACEDHHVPVRRILYARYRLAEALVAVGEREEAAGLLSDLVVEAPRNGVSVVARWARELGARAGMAVSDPDAAAAGPSAPGVSGLTPRELQVLGLVAEGLTNPQIGERLFISPKTASVHVSAILGKVGAANRAEAAALYAAAAAPESS